MTTGALGCYELRQPGAREYRNMVRIDLLRAFVILGETGNYNVAARSLGMAQPTLTKQINRLEDIIGHQLFQRSRQGTELTDFGRQYLKEVQPLIREADRVWEFGLRMASGETGQLSLGFTFSTLATMSRALIAFEHAYPKIDVALHDISSQSQLPMLRDHRLDVAFARWPGGADLASQVITRDRLAFVYPVELAAKIQSIDSPAARTLPFIRLKRTVAPGFEAAVQRLFDWKNIEPSVTHYVNESLVQLGMVTSGLGVAIMHESALKGIIDDKRLVSQGIEGPGLVWQTGMFWRKGESNPVVQNFLAIARNTVNGTA